MPQLSLDLQLTSIFSIAIVDDIRKRDGYALPYTDNLSKEVLKEKNGRGVCQVALIASDNRKSRENICPKA